MKFSESSEKSNNKNKNRNRNKNSIILYTKSKDLNDSSNILLENSKMNKSLKLKNNNTNSMNHSEKNFENSREQIKCELKKIKQFKKIVTRNSKVFAQKFGKDIISTKKNDAI